MLLALDLTSSILRGLNYDLFAMIILAGLLYTVLVILSTIFFLYTGFKLRSILSKDSGAVNMNDRRKKKLKEVRSGDIKILVLICYRRLYTSHSAVWDCSCGWSQWFSEDWRHCCGCLTTSSCCGSLSSWAPHLRVRAKAIYCNIALDINAVLGFMHVLAIHVPGGKESTMSSSALGVSTSAKDRT